MKLYALLCVLAFGLVGVNLHAMDVEAKEAADQGCYADLVLLDDKLIEAVCFNEHGQAESLLKAGGNPNALLREDGGSVGSALHCALESSDSKMVDLLLFYKADVRSKASIVTYGVAREREPLHTAVLEAYAHKGMDCVRLLGPHADIHVATSWGETPLAIAASGKGISVMAYLLGCGAWTDVNKANEFGWTPLMRACMSMKKIAGSGYKMWHCNPTQLRYLLSSGANPRLRARDGKTAAEMLESDYQIGPDEPNRARHIELKRMAKQMLEHDISELDYERTAKDIIEVSPLEPRARGNVFKQFAHRQSGITKPLSKEILQSKRAEREQEKVIQDMLFHGPC